MNLIIPEIDNDPAILKVIHDGERLEREAYRKELMQILKIQPKSTNDEQQAARQTNYTSINQETTPLTPGSANGTDRTNQIWIKRTVPTTPKSKMHHREHHHSALHQRSLNSSGESSTNRSFNDSPRSSYQSFMRQTRSDTNLSSSPMSNCKTSPMQMHSNISLTPSGVLVMDHRQSMTMKRIVNPQWNIIPFA